MSDLTFKITRLFAGTENQKKVGIHGTFNLDMSNDDGIVVSFKDLMLRQSREGKYYIESPFNTYEGKDKEGNPKTQKNNYVRLFPEEKNRSKQDALVQMVLEELNKTPKKTQGAFTTNKSSGYSNNQSKATPAPAKQSNDIW
jgi:hypothetical protein